LKSNAPEMVVLQRWLSQEKISLEIKRGNKVKGTYKYSIKNDELGQILLSFVHQQPGTARSGKRKIFDTPAIYSKLFKVNYDRDPQKKVFIKDIIELDSRYAEIEKKLKFGGLLDSTQIEVLKNGKQTIFALMGVCYRLINADISENELINDPKSVANIPFVFGSVLSNYHEDDIENKLEKIVKYVVMILADAYTYALDSGQTTSVSNFMKTDQRYYSEIVSKFARALGMMMVGKELKDNIDVFKRE